MNDINEEGLQGQGFASGDEETYAMLYSLLDRVPSAAAPVDFSGKMRARFEAMQNRKDRIRSYLTALMIVLASFGLLYGGLSILHSFTAIPFILTLLQYKWVVLFGGVTILLIQFVDEQVVKDRLLRKGY